MRWDIETFEAMGRLVPKAAAHFRIKWHSNCLQCLPHQFGFKILEHSWLAQIRRVNLAVPTRARLRNVYKSASNWMRKRDGSKKGKERRWFPRLVSLQKTRAF